jgi:hypothetical protein
MGANEPEGPWRVEWHLGDRIEVVARFALAFAHHTTLEPVVTRMQRDGHRVGVLALVDEIGGAVVARRRLDRSVHRRGGLPSLRTGHPAVRRGGQAPRPREVPAVAQGAMVAEAAAD